MAWYYHQPKENYETPIQTTQLKKITVIDYGAGNLASVRYALERLGVKVELTTDPKTLIKAEKVIFPGVGHAAAAMTALRATGLGDVIPRLQVPVLGICLGMQLMCSATEEGNVNGLGIFSGKVIRFAPGLKVPHMGWNVLTDLNSPLFIGMGKTISTYFVHSYFVPAGMETTAVTEYGVSFSAALQKNNFHAVQFHPEKSGLVGARILRQFIKL